MELPEDDQNEEIETPAFSELPALLKLTFSHLRGNKLSTLGRERTYYQNPQRRCIIDITHTASEATRIPLERLCILGWILTGGRGWYISSCAFFNLVLCYFEVIPQTKSPDSSQLSTHCSPRKCYPPPLWYQVVASHRVPKRVFPKILTLTFLGAN